MDIVRPRGTNDFLPKDTVKWHYLETVLRKLCEEFGYGEIRTPLFEDTNLFQRGVGDTTDIVQKEMYTFTDQGDRSLTLRPEGTASVVRAYVEDKLYGEAQPVKVYYMGPMFRYERPQAGRYRQFHQFGVECFGSNHPAADGEIIALAWEFYRRLGLKGLEVSINSVGCPKCRPKYRQLLQDYFRPHLDKMCKSCQERFEKNPLRILDCKNPECKELAKDAPNSTDCLCEECQEHFQSVCAYLTAADIPYKIDHRLVRGLDYYTKTAFEILVDTIGAQSAICGGGRYDGLVAQLGGPETPGVGFAAGLERVLVALDQQGVEIPASSHTQVYLASLGSSADLKAFQLLQELRKTGIIAEKDLLGRSLKAQMKYADKLQADYVLLLGEEELAQNICMVRQMGKSEQAPVDLDNIVLFLKEQLK
ncbi:MAG: histidine--tRNA ligase [Peptococcaceae bacterium]|jgi:histidyl-tRNA synthetase|nr:histidine--tRNA ligase [Peptococcaceae bacterium]